MPTKKRNGESYQESFRISVVVTHYNRPALCVRCLQSILSQTRAPYEVIIVDDNSDADLSEIEGLAKQNHWQFILKKENRFVADSRKRGVQAASGTHVVFIDDDDAFYPEAISIFHDLLEVDSEVPWSCRLRVLTEESLLVDQPKFGVTKKTTFREFLNPLFSIHATIVPRALLLEHAFDTSLRYYEDIDVWLSIFCDLKEWKFSDSVVGLYDRSNEVGITRVSLKSYRNQVETFRSFLLKHDNHAIQEWSRVRLFGAYHCLGRASLEEGLTRYELVSLLLAIYQDGNLTIRRAREGAKLWIKLGFIYGSRFEGQGAILKKNDS